ncbi:MAG: VWA domain-containing protein [Pyrinomonadaceae bacterium]
MRLALLAVAVLLLSAVASSAQQDGGEEGVHPERPEVVLPLGAVDKEGRPFEGLKPEDLRVTVEGQPQNLRYFSRRTDEPLHVVIMLDASASQEKLLPLVQDAADQLVPALLQRPNRNDAAVVSFTGSTTIVQDLTANAATVRRAIATVEFVPPPGYIRGGVLVGRPNPNDPAYRAGETAIWEALVNVCNEVFARAKPGRRAVVLVTDGVDTSSRLKLNEAVERLLREGVAVYGIGIGDEQEFDGVNRKVVRKLAEQTGGRALFPKKSKDLPSAFEQVQRELLDSYTLKFAAPPMQPGTSLKLRVELVNPELRKQGVQLAYPQALFK